MSGINITSKMVESSLQNLLKLNDCSDIELENFTYDFNKKNYGIVISFNVIRENIDFNLIFILCDDNQLNNKIQHIYSPKSKNKYIREFYSKDEKYGFYKMIVTYKGDNPEDNYFNWIFM